MLIDWIRDFFGQPPIQKQKKMAQSNGEIQTFVGELLAATDERPCYLGKIYFSHRNDERNETKDLYFVKTEMSEQTQTLLYIFQVKQEGQENGLSPNTEEMFTQIGYEKSSDTDSFPQLVFCNHCGRYIHRKNKNCPITACGQGNQPFKFIILISNLVNQTYYPGVNRIIKFKIIPEATLHNSINNASPQSILVASRGQGFTSQLNTYDAHGSSSSSMNNETPQQTSGEFFSGHYPTIFPQNLVVQHPYHDTLDSYTYPYTSSSSSMNNETPQQHLVEPFLRQAFIDNQNTMNLPTMSANFYVNAFSDPTPQHPGPSNQPHASFHSNPLQFTQAPIDIYYQLAESDGSEIGTVDIVEVKENGNIIHLRYTLHCLSCV